MEKVFDENESCKSWCWGFTCGKLLEPARTREQVISFIILIFPYMLHANVG